MTENHLPGNSPDPRTPLDAAIDAALTRALVPPELPLDFRARLNAALAREAGSEAGSAQVRARLEREQRQRLAEFEAGYLRLRRRTLVTLVGGAFTAGAVITFALPWLRSVAGPNTPLLLVAVGSAIGLAIGLSAWFAQRTSAPTL